MINFNSKIFDKVDQIPIWNKVNGFLVCTDHKTGKELKRIVCPKDSNGLDLKVFTKYQVKLIKDIRMSKESAENHLSKAIIEPAGFDDEFEMVNVKEGHTCYLVMKPNGRFTITDRDNINALGVSVDPDAFELIKPGNKLKIK